MKIDKLSAMLNSLQQEVTKLSKGKTVLTASTKALDYCGGIASNSSLMDFIGTFTIRFVCCASICNNTD